MFHTEPEPEQPKKPNITVTVSSPVLQIVEVGNTVRLSCSGYHTVDRVSIKQCHLWNLIFNNVFFLF